MITTIIFDWGGVLTTGKYTQALLEELSRIREISIDTMYDEFDQLIHQMDERKLVFDDFIKRVNEKWELNVTENELTKVFKDAIHPNEGAIKIAEKLSNKYKLIMLSNNHEKTIQQLEKHHTHLLKIFPKQYFSGRIGIRKPNVQFFEYVIEKERLVPKECVFIDDKQKNVDAAEKVGMKGILFIDVGQLKKDLSDASIELN